jgi:Flp pilus assembly protein TadD
MTRYNRFWHGAVVLAMGLSCLAGCRNSGNLLALSPSSVTGGEAGSRVTGPQAADLQVALGRAREKRGEPGPAMAAYQEALKQDPKRADALVRLAVLYDRQGKFKESEALYRKALAAQPGNPDIYSNMGYSLYLQRRWEEAEMNLRQAVVLQPDHRRAHNNLGLVLAHAGRGEEAFGEFLHAGCTQADAHANLAFVLALQRHWPEARKHYEQALAANPVSAPARKGLQEVRSLMAKADPAFQAAPPKPGMVQPQQAPEVQRTVYQAAPLSPRAPEVSRKQAPAGKEGIIWD